MGAGAVLFPLPTHAAFEWFTGLTNSVTSVLNGVITLLLAVAVVVFFVGLIKLIGKAGQNPQMVAQARRTMGWGLVIIFVMATLWGIIYFARCTFGVESCAIIRGVDAPTPGLENDPFNNPNPFDRDGAA